MFAVPDNTIALPPADLLTRHPVRTALEFAADRNRWRNLLRYDPEERFAALLDVVGGHEVWLLSWLPGQDTGLHDHGATTGAFTVVSGRLVEEVYRDTAGSPDGPETHVVEAGQSRVFGPGYAHHVRNPGPDPVISVHVYQDGGRTVRRLTRAETCSGVAVPAGT
ncbi:cysteine dioxygenase [Saccharomonospora azurea]|uniref:cysteine dioxygenase n=1 Tax=Saccharomonospora azurea TaxID=40988 RepID=UPI00023FF6BB|nr:cysteine dioxygenase family protein [Saccharomonospora azurea]EHK82865.1 cysteine dioxygenase [Saccharomonospora azurea SZMC 14600]